MWCVGGWQRLKVSSKIPVPHESHEYQASFQCPRDSWSRSVAQHPNSVEARDGLKECPSLTSFLAENNGNLFYLGDQRSTRGRGKGSSIQPFRKRHCQVFFLNKRLLYIFWTLHTLSLTILSSYTVHLTFSPQRYHAWREACCCRHLGSRSLTSTVRTERWSSGACKTTVPSIFTGDAVDNVDVISLGKLCSVPHRQRHRTGNGWPALLCSYP